MTFFKTMPGITAVLVIIAGLWLYLNADALMQHVTVAFNGLLK